MRVGMLTGSVSRQGGGVFDSVRGLSLALREHEGVDVHVFGLADEDTEQDRAFWDGLPVHAAAITAVRPFGYARELYGFVRDADLDILHTHCTWMYPSLVSLKWSGATGRPVVVSPRGDLDPWAVGNSRFKKLIAAAVFERRHLKRAAVLNALCVAEADSFRAYGLTNPIAIIPNGVDLPDLSRAGDAPPWAGFAPDGANVLLFMGRIHPKKNIAALIEAWASSHASPGAGNWWLAIAGWEQVGYEGELKALAAKLAAPRVLFIGPQHGAAKDACFRNARGFVLPSLSEGLPRAVLEAWSYGLPVLMTPECNLPEGALAGAAIETSGTVEGIATGLRRLFDQDEGERAQMGAAGRALVEHKFTWKQVAADSAALYRSLAK